MDKVFDIPKESTHYNPYIITFAVGKNATGEIILNSDAIDAIVSERLRERVEQGEVDIENKPIDADLIEIIKSYL